LHGTSIGFGSISTEYKTFLLKGIIERLNELDLNEVSNLSSVLGARAIDTKLCVNKSKEAML
jgi:hypothetical protein